jgi:hypothetical protein
MKDAFTILVFDVKYGKVLFLRLMKIKNRHHKEILISRKNLWLENNLFDGSKR